MDWIYFKVTEWNHFFLVMYEMLIVFKPPFMNSTYAVLAVSIDAVPL